MEQRAGGKEKSETGYGVQTQSSKPPKSYPHKTHVCLAYRRAAAKPSPPDLRAGVTAPGRRAEMKAPVNTDAVLCSRKLVRHT